MQATFQEFVAKRTRSVSLQWTAGISRLRLVTRNGKSLATNRLDSWLQSPASSGQPRSLGAALAPHKVPPMTYFSCARLQNKAGRLERTKCCSLAVFFCRDNTWFVSRHPSYIKVGAGHIPRVCGKKDTKCESPVDCRVFKAQASYKNRQVLSHKQASFKASISSLFWPAP